MYKKETRVLGIDDAHFEKFGKQKECLIVGVMYRGGSFIDAVLSTKVTVDGDDATEKISQMVKKFSGKTQLRAVFLNGIAVGGFNVIDIFTLHEQLKLPIIVIVRKDPNLEKVITVLKKLGKEHASTVVKKAGKPKQIGKVYMQVVGITDNEARELIELTSTHSYIPEPLRVAHLIGQGIVLGQSKGKA